MRDAFTRTTGELLNMSVLPCDVSERFQQRQLAENFCSITLLNEDIFLCLPQWRQ